MAFKRVSSNKFNNESDQPTYVRVTVGSKEKGFIHRSLTVKDARVSEVFAAIEKALFSDEQEDDE